MASRVIAEGLLPEQTPVSKVMTRTPIFVTSDTLAIKDLQKMVQGKLKHLPIVENGEVIAMLDITKCPYLRWRRQLNKRVLLQLQLRGWSCKGVVMDLVLLLRSRKTNVYIKE
ncbi:hypothetical protein S83_062360 [Arachis hypogaea]